MHFVTQKTLGNAGFPRESSDYGYGNMAQDTKQSLVLAHSLTMLHEGIHKVCLRGSCYFVDVFQQCAIFRDVNAGSDAKHIAGFISFLFLTNSNKFDLRLTCPSTRRATFSVVLNVKNTHFYASIVRLKLSISSTSFLKIFDGLTCGC